MQLAAGSTAMTPATHYPHRMLWALNAARSCSLFGSSCVHILALLPHTEPFVVIIIATGIDNWMVLRDQTAQCLLPAQCLARAWEGGWLSHGGASAKVQYRTTHNTFFVVVVLACSLYTHSLTDSLTHKQWTGNSWSGRKKDLWERFRTRTAMATAGCLVRWLHLYSTTAVHSKAREVRMLRHTYVHRTEHSPGGGSVVVSVRKERLLLLSSDIQCTADTLEINSRNKS